MVETLAESILLYDLGLTNEEDAVTNSSCCSTSCPQAEDVTQNITVLALADGDAEVTIEHQTPLVGAGLIQLANTPIAGYDVKVSRNGVLQREGAAYDYTWFNATGLLQLPAGKFVVAGDVFSFEYAVEL